MRLSIVRSGPLAPSETFIIAHATRLSGELSLVHDLPPRLWSPQGSVDMVSRSSLQGLVRSIRSRLSGNPQSYSTASYKRVFKKLRPDVVLAEYGPSGVEVLEACRNLNIPMVVHFHGYDASRFEVLERYRDDYRRLFEYSSAIVAVSPPMAEALRGMGAPDSKMHVNACGVDIGSLLSAVPVSAPPSFVFAGRFVEKKAPHLALLAFHEVQREHPNARLRMIGDGPLMGVCRDIVSSLGLTDSVTFLGMQSHQAVLTEMSAARAYVQHSVVAVSGDSEGTPVAVMEAAGMGLPVVSTSHAGIPDVVIDGVTGFLVPERDVHAMASRMKQLLIGDAIVMKMSQAAVSHIREHFTMDMSLQRLDKILQAAAR